MAGGVEGGLFTCHPHLQGVLRGTTHHSPGWKESPGPSLVLYSLNQAPVLFLELNVLLLLLKEVIIFSASPVLSPFPLPYHC